jgi:heme oxygenase
VETAAAHALIEARLGLPAAVRTPQDYAVLLGRFFGIYRSLEQLLAGFPDWSESGIALPARGHAECLAADLEALNVDPRTLPLIPRRLLPELPAFPHAVGALYVLEGATLGGRLIMRDLEPRLGPAIAGATCFFGGRGELAVPMWRHFSAALDTFGREQPGHHAAVVAGAERTFHAILAWFTPLPDGDLEP